jgi:uridylate kinase
MTLPKFKRILLKLSGEVLMGNQPFGIDTDFVASLAAEVKAAKDTGLELCLVIGGGNIFAAWQALPRAWTVRRPITWACWRP